MLYKLDKLLDCVVFHLNLIGIYHLRETGSEFLCLFVFFAHLLTGLKVMRLFVSQELTVLVNHLAVFGA